MLIKEKGKVTDAVEILRSMAVDDPNFEDRLAAEREKLEIARKIYELRAAAGLTQAQLAKKVGTTRAVISLLEDADYDGQAMPMLRRIATALEKRVEIRLLPLKRLQSA